MLSGPELFVMVLLLNDLYSPLWTFVFQIVYIRNTFKGVKFLPRLGGAHKWLAHCSASGLVSLKRQAEVGSGTLPAPLHLPRIRILTAHMFITDFDTVSF